uniref:Uncharacterized protein n=1 Tax=Salix viminalis TaxID=40686 RepID=A0A6N2NHW0_SALVM
MKKMFVLFVLMVAVLFFVIAGVVRRHTIRRVSKGTRHFFDRRLNGTVGGIFAAVVRRLHIICATHVHTLCAKDVLKMLIIYVSEGIKDCVVHA